MRDCLKNGTGFDRVLMAVAATFLTVSATSAFAQADPARNSAAELAIEAAIPRPEPANLPPPTINDFKMDTTASVPDAAKVDAAKTEPPKATEKPAEAKPADVVTAPKSEPESETNKSDTPTPRPCRLLRPPSPQPPRHRPRPRQRLPSSLPRPPATCRRRISRSPTSSRKCWAENRCAISSARPNGPRSKNSTPRVILRRYGRRAAR